MRAHLPPTKPRSAGLFPVWPRWSQSGSGTDLGGRDRQNARFCEVFAVSQHPQEEVAYLENEKKTRTAVWLRPGTIRKIDEWMEKDNCRSEERRVGKEC